jgi:hypothetical protein
MMKCKRNLSVTKISTSASSTGKPSAELPAQVECSSFQSKSYNSNTRKGKELKRSCKESKPKGFEGRIKEVTDTLMNTLKETKESECVTQLVVCPIVRVYNLLYTTLTKIEQITSAASYAITASLLKGMLLH